KELVICHPAACRVPERNPKVVLRQNHLHVLIIEQLAQIESATLETLVFMPDRKLHVVPLGGLGEFGMNSMAIRYGDDIIVIDAGMMFPEAELLGVDIVTPDFAYLEENREHVRALLLTHGHEDHIGGIP